MLVESKCVNLTSLKSIVAPDLQKVCFKNRICNSVVQPTTHIHSDLLPVSCRIKEAFGPTLKQWGLAMLPSSLELILLYFLKNSQAFFCNRSLQSKLSLTKRKANVGTIWKYRLFQKDLSFVSLKAAFQHTTKMISSSICSRYQDCCKIEIKKLRHLQEETGWPGFP